MLDKQLKFGFAMLSFLSVALFTSCASTTEHKVSMQYLIEVENDDWGTYEGNLESSVNYSNLIEGMELTANQIKSVTIDGAEFQLSPESKFGMDAFTSAKVEISGAESGMQSIATLNPISTSGNKIALAAAQDAELDSYFKSGNYLMHMQLIGTEVEGIELPSTVLGELTLNLTLTIIE